MVRSDLRHPAPHKDWAQLNSRRKAKGATAGLVAPFPRPLVVPTVMTFKTFADVRALMRPPPAEHRERPTWRHVAAELARRLAVIMHRIWVDGTEFRWTREQAAAA